ncbi:MAG: SH3 domain-containing protein [Pseudomonadota bacterium]
MVRFIIACFALLGWGFYEMSGGAEFEPRTARAAPVSVETLPEQTQTAQTQDQQVEVTRVALDLTSVEDVKPAVQTVAKVVETAPETPAPAGNDGTWQTVVLPSLIPAAEPEDVEDDVELASLNVVSDAVETSTPVYEIRTVTGNRVNVRGGPGTTFGVVGKLVRGDEVEILDDIGTGWVRFRAVDGDTQGWLADFLLTNN